MKYREVDEKKRVTEYGKRRASKTEGQIEEKKGKMIHLVNSSEIIHLVDSVIRCLMFL